MKIRFIRPSFARIALLFAVAAAQAEDWPQVRGPNRDRVWNETDLLKTFPGDGLKIRWHAAMGFDWSSPVVAQGRVFVADALLAKPASSERALCFDEAISKE